MILILSLNSALDKTLSLRHLRKGRLHRPEGSLTLAGGKGINVARALKALGVPTRILGFIAGQTGEHIARAARAEGLKADWIRLARGESRTCLALLNGGKRPTEINEEGPSVSAGELARLKTRYLELLPSCRLAVFSGRLPPGAPADFYARLIRLSKARGVPCALDTSQPALDPALDARPDIAKPNQEELLSLGYATRGAALKRALSRLGGRTGGQTYITLGERGALAFHQGAFWKARTPPIRAVDTIGCGDTFLAGLIYGDLLGLNAPGKLAYAGALATASALSLGAGIFKPGVLRRMLARVRVRAF